MTEQQAIRALEQHADWLRGGNDSFMLTPKGLIEAIEAVVETTKQHPIGTCPFGRIVLVMIPDEGTGPAMSWCEAIKTKDCEFIDPYCEDSEPYYTPMAWRELPEVPE